MRKNTKASTELGELIRYYREKKNMTLADLGKKVGVSYIHISYLEKGLRIPSEDLLREIARFFAENREEEIKIRQKMFLLLAQIKAPDEIADKIILSDQVAPKMPEPFWIMLEKSIENKKKLIESIEKDILRNRKYLSRDEIKQLATTLCEDENVFLLLAGYLPDKEFSTIVVKDKF